MKAKNYARKQYHAYFKLEENATRSVKMNKKKLSLL